MEAVCDWCGEVFNERLELQQCVSCSVPGCHVQVHRLHIPKLCRKSKLWRRKRKDLSADWICLKCSKSSSIAAFHPLLNNDDTSRAGTFDERASVSSRPSSGLAATSHLFSGPGHFKQQFTERVEIPPRAHTFGGTINDLDGDELVRRRPPLERLPPVPRFATTTTPQEPSQIATASWDSVEKISTEILTHLVQNIAYDTLLALEDALRPFKKEIEAILLKCRVGDLMNFSPSISNQVDENVEQFSGAGFKEGLRAMTTKGLGDCYYSSASWVVSGSADCINMMRLITLHMVVKYSCYFDTSAMRIDIGEHHGPDGVLSLARSIGASGHLKLHTILAQKYPDCVQNFHFASVATILASSISLKARVVVFEDLGASTAGMLTLARVQQSFDKDNHQSSPSNQKTFCACKQIYVSPYYRRIIRVNCSNEHFVALMPNPILSNDMFLPSTNITQPTLPPLDAEDF